MINDSFPDYQNPPIVEVALSLEFAPPRGLNLAHLGGFWYFMRNELPTAKVAQVIPATTEDFSSEGQWVPPSFQVAFTDELDCRLQLTSKDDQWMLQIQRDRLVVNWRKRTEEYPRYEVALSKLINSWRYLCTYLEEISLPPPTPRLWELTYVNRIVKLPLWNTPTDWPSVLPGLWAESPRPTESLNLRGLYGQWAWGNATPPARLYVDTKPAKSGSEELLMLSLTARGPTASAADQPPQNLDGPIAGMNYGHALIVATFDGITSRTAKAHWKNK